MNATVQAAADALVAQYKANEEIVLKDSMDKFCRYQPSLASSVQAEMDLSLAQAIYARAAEISTTPVTGELALSLAKEELFQILWKKYGQQFLSEYGAAMGYLSERKSSEPVHRTDVFPDGGDILSLKDGCLFADRFPVCGSVFLEHTNGGVIWLVKPFNTLLICVTESDEEIHRSALVEATAQLLYDYRYQINLWNVKTQQN